MEGELKKSTLHYTKDDGFMPVLSSDSGSGFVLLSLQGGELRLVDG